MSDSVLPFAANILWYGFEEIEISIRVEAIAQKSGHEIFFEISPCPDLATQKEVRCPAVRTKPSFFGCVHTGANETTTIAKSVFGDVFNAGSASTRIKPRNRRRDFGGGIMSRIWMRCRYFHWNLQL